MAAALTANNILHNRRHGIREDTEKWDSQHQATASRDTRDAPRDPHSHRHESIARESGVLEPTPSAPQFGCINEELTLPETSESLRPPRKKPLEWVVHKRYVIPRQVVARACHTCQTLDANDSPDHADRPGFMKENTVRDMVFRFENIFGRESDVSSANKLTGVIEHLRKHTRRRRGAAVLKEGYIEWEQTSRIYELFSTDLNIFERIFYTVDVGSSAAVLPKCISFFLIGMIFLSISCWMVSTLPSVQTIPNKDESTGADCSTNTQKGECQPEPHVFFKTMEKICVITFTVEYFIRLATAHSVRRALFDDNFLEAVLCEQSVIDVKVRKMRSTTTQVLETPTMPTKPVKAPIKLDGKLKATFDHVRAVANIIDLLAILPFWLDVLKLQAGGGFLVVLRILRLTRVFRVFKLGKYNEMFTLFSRVAAQSLPALLLMVFFIGLSCCLFGTLVWFAEQGEWYPKGNPKLGQLDLPISGRGAFLRETGDKDNGLEESPFQSILHTSWYVIVTITTVGYGDIAPKTPEGQFIGALTILNGVIVLAMPIGVVGANFGTEYYELVNDKKRRQRMARELEMQLQVEEQQDALAEELTSEMSAEEEDADASASEILRVDASRQRILLDAEALDETWHLIFPEVLYRELSEELRFFVFTFVGVDPSQQQSVTGSQSKPKVHMSDFTALDSITTHVIAAISSVTSSDEFAEFGLKEAHEFRLQWHAFTELCWDHAINNCMIEQRAAAPEYFQMKAYFASKPALAYSASRSLTKKSVRRSNSQSLCGTFSSPEAALYAEARLAIGDGPPPTGSPNPPQVGPPELVPESTGPRPGSKNGSPLLPGIPAEDAGNVNTAS